MDSLSYVGAVVVLAPIALLASYIPARRAARIDQMVSLRVE
jgi:ABC-type lipoprotein release transport system permease subunit